MKLSKERMDQLNQSLNEGAKNMETINYNNFYLTGITEELYTSEELLDIVTDIQDIVVLVRHKEENKTKIIKLKRENLGREFIN